MCGLLMSPSVPPLRPRLKPYVRTQALARLEDTGTPLGWQNLAIKRLMGEGSYGEVFEVGSTRCWQVPSATAQPGISPSQLPQAESASLAAAGLSSCSRT